MRARKEMRQVKEYEVLVIGLGNSLAGDDGFGPQVIQHLQSQILPRGVMVLEGGTDAFALIPYLEQAQKVILIDVLQAGERPGTLYRIPLNRLRSFGRGFSQHQLSLLDLYQLPYTKWQLDLPDGLLFGVEVGPIELFNETLTPRIREQVPVVAAKVMAEVKEQFQVQLYTKG